MNQDQHIELAVLVEFCLVNPILNILIEYMKNKFQNKKQIHSLNIDVSLGSYALDTIPLCFEHCRERFSSVFDENTNGIFFKTLPDRVESVAKFIWHTENVLGNKECQNQSIFSLTNINSIVWLNPSIFWKSCIARRSLFTILLRCGNNYVDNYEEALFSDPYANANKRSIMRFLFGYTKYVGPEIIKGYGVQTRGWSKVFEGKSDSEIKSLLVKSNQSEFSHFEIRSKEALWLN